MNILLIGGSRGIGLAAAEAYNKDHRLFSVSRTPSPFGQWINADLATQEGLGSVVSALDGIALDALLYLGGIWEEGAFTQDYDFLSSSDEEIDRVLAVNCTAPIKLVKALRPNLIQASTPKVIFMGSLTGLDNGAGPEVANSASKYGLRGAAQALRKALAGDKIAFTVINPGNVATPEVLDDFKSGVFPAKDPIPMDDLLAVIACCLKLSGKSTLSEVNIRQLDL